MPYRLFPCCPFPILYHFFVRADNHFFRLLALTTTTEFRLEPHKNVFLEQISRVPLHERTASRATLPTTVLSLSGPAFVLSETLRDPLRNSDEGSVSHSNNTKKHHANIQCLLATSLSNTLVVQESRVDVDEWHASSRTDNGDELIQV